MTVFLVIIAGIGIYDLVYDCTIALGTVVGCGDGLGILSASISFTVVIAITTIFLYWRNRIKKSA